MPRAWDDYREKVGEFIRAGKFADGTKVSPRKLPPPEKTREVLNETFRICEEREFRLVLVEDLGDFKVFIQVPGEKSECDFFVWYARFSNGEIEEYKVPSHDELAKWFTELKKQSEIVEEFLINSIIRLIRDRMSVEEILDRYFRGLEEGLKKEVLKFLLTLKWISVQEDTNYPPPKKMGSKYTLALYALLEAGFSLRDIRRIVRF
ncbi:hypothetical protein [Archaeoglobus sp.]|uniref:hypothetical protein n=1 Tax=Archaeoglobus sp. TaxID=1872626 RepID=UPI0024AA5D08|nr:hypothetical protein [Archaeoglobus sp.]MDI3496663.1 hypothetical protein [Archaeoglobus sp.]